MLIIKDGTINDAVTHYPYKADILVEEGKIARVAPSIDQQGAKVVDASGLNVYPGLVDCSSSLGLGEDRSRLNMVGSNTCAPQTRALDGVSPFDSGLAGAVAAGVTTICTGPRNISVIGGSSVTYKALGKRIDDMVVRSAATMECAFAEETGMEDAALLREELFKARDYAQRVDAAMEPVSKKSGETRANPEKLPEFDIRMNALLPVVRGLMPLRVHATSSSLLFTALRIGREFGLKVVLEYQVDAPQAVEELAASGAPIVLVPEADSHNAAVLEPEGWRSPSAFASAGAQPAIASGNLSLTSECGLADYARAAIKQGMSHFDALRAVTATAASIAGADERCGTISKGKDADLVLCEGDLFEAGSIKAVYCGGVQVL